MEAEINEALMVLSKDKHTKSKTLKTESEEGIRKLEEYSSETEPFSDYIKKTPIIVIPFVKAIQELSIKHKGFLPSIMVIQKLIERNMIAKEFVGHILEGFKKCVESYSDVRMRILQIILPFAENPSLVRGNNLLQLFKIGLLLVETLNMQSSGTSKVVVCHLVSMVFERPGMLSGQEQAEAIKDCKHILQISLESIKQNNLFGLELLSASLVENGTAFKDPKLVEIQENMISLLIEKLESSKPLVIAKILSVFLKIVTNMIKDENKIVLMLLLIYNTLTSRTNLILRKEFFYLLSDRIVQIAALANIELSDEIFQIAESVSITRARSIRPLNIDNTDKSEIAEYPGYLDALSLSKVMSMSKRVKVEGSEKFTLEIYLQYFVNALEKMVYTAEDEIEENDIATVKESISALAYTLIDHPESVNRLISSVYSLAQRYPVLFYSLAVDLSFANETQLTIWKEFFEMTVASKNSFVETDIWSDLLERLNKSSPIVISSALEGACASTAVPAQRHMILFLSLMKHIPEIPNVFSAVFRRVVSGSSIEEEEDGPRLIAQFFEMYFSSADSKVAHSIVMPCIEEVFMQTYSTAPNSLITKQILSSLSLGIRSAGEILQKSWINVYSILETAIQSVDLHSIVFDILQVVTDRLLFSLPQECLLSTTRMVCICCTATKEENISLRALFCIREITEYVICAEIPNKIRNHVWYTCLCLLCTIAYDQRGDIRDSTVVQMFESIYFYKDKREMDWKPLIQVFLRRILSAAVYAKDKEIYSGEHESISSASDSEERAINRSEDTCLCLEAGGCISQVPATETADTPQRSLDSTKNIILTASSLIFEYFDEIQDIPGFNGLWSLLEKIFVRFSNDSELKPAILHLLQAGLSKIQTKKYQLQLFYAISEICCVSDHSLEYRESLVQVLKESYRGIDRKKDKKEIERFFDAITSLLKNTHTLEEDRLVFLEFEAIWALENEDPLKWCSIQVCVLLKWLEYSQKNANTMSIHFIRYCMDQLSEKIVCIQLPIEVHKETSLILLSFHERKQIHPFCWQSAKKTLQKLLEFEAEQSEVNLLIWTSRSLLGLPTDETERESSPNRETRNRNLMRMISVTDISNQTQMIKEEEYEMIEYIYFLSMLALKAKTNVLEKIAGLLIETQEMALSNALLNLYLETTKIICLLLSIREELSNLSKEWTLSAISKYNKETRMQGIGYSYIQRKAIEYILLQISLKNIRHLDNSLLLKELVLITATEDKYILRIAIDILQAISATCT
ncbi:hypothetical protein NEOKW01_1808 [Nematocida sp. AWRm80]|nr:hypothetical protein NEOKW01_1808 [Nematocida sp. AWRm80]